MIKLLKQLVKKFLATRNLEIVPINSYFHKLERVKNDWLKAMDIKTIIDVGASDGGFAMKIKEVIPSAQLYCFEALEDIYEVLNVNLKNMNKITTVNMAMSDKIGQVSFMMMTTPADNPYGKGASGSKYQGQRGPTPSKYFENFL